MKFLTVARWEFIHRIKSKWFLISTLLIPLIIVGASVLPTLLLQHDTEAKTFALIDQTGWIGNELVDVTTQKYHLDDGRPLYQWIPLHDQSLASAKTAADSLLHDDIVTGYVVIPDSVTMNHRADYYGKSVSNFKDQTRIQSQLSSIVSHHLMQEKGLDPDLIAELTADINLNSYSVKGGEVSQSNELMTFIGPYFYIMLLFFAIFLSSQILMRSVLEERQNRVMEVLISSITPNTLLSGKVLGLGLMGVVQIIVYMVVAQLVAVYNGIALLSLTSVIGFFVYFIPGFLLYAAFYAAVGSLFTSEQEAQQVVQFMSFIIILPIMFLMFAMNNPNAMLVKILTYIPPFTPFFMIMRMNITSLPVWEYVVSLVELITFVWISLRLGGKVFNTAILMYGKRPTFPEILRWIRA